jgi:hypothetical protein
VAAASLPPTQIGFDSQYSTAVTAHATLSSPTSAQAVNSH